MPRNSVPTSPLAHQKLKPDLRRNNCTGLVPGHWRERGLQPSKVSRYPLYAAGLIGLLLVSFMIREQWKAQLLWAELRSEALQSSLPFLNWFLLNYSHTEVSDVDVCITFI